MLAVAVMLVAIARWRPVYEEATEVGTFYLLHFDRPVGHAAHYAGWTRSLKGRIHHHRNGTGARLTQVARERGIGFTIAKVVAGVTRAHERRVKNMGGLGRNCPICQGRLSLEEAKTNEEALLHV